MEALGAYKAEATSRTRRPTSRNTAKELAALGEIEISTGKDEELIY